MQVMDTTLSKEGLEDATANVDETALRLERAREGDERALAWLYDTYSPRIYRYLFRRTGNADVAEDLTGAVFLKVVDAIHSQSAWRSSFTGWLYRIAHNMLSDHRRTIHRRRECPLPDTLPATPSASLEDRAARGAALDVVSSMIRELRPDYAAVLQLRFADGLPHAAVARRLGKTEGAVKVAQHRAIKLLRSRLAERYEPAAA
jgi:RNA polymerase sigma-70 factor (ECF subfamily)